MQGVKNFRTYFFRGLAALLPTILTIWIFVQCYTFIKNNISNHINRGVVGLLVAAIDWYPPIGEDEKKEYAKSLEPGLGANPEALQARIEEDEIIHGTRVAVASKYWVTGPGQIAGFILALLGVVFVGAFLASVAGRTLWRMFEKALMNIPVVKKIYPYIKQITDFMLTRKKLSFNKVVAIQYPRKGVWSVAMVTGTGLRKVVGSGEKEFLTVFVPTSPTPFTGYVIMTPKDETVELDMTIEEALRFTISGGVITPAEHEAFQAMTNKDGDSGV
ncbi:MAG: DUF502 domain-containing protein [Planctomycetota bacterium]|jgi:uncharacterized membrane protein